jgi:hypothetical protein
MSERIWLSLAHMGGQEKKVYICFAGKKNI